MPRFDFSELIGSDDLIPSSSPNVESGQNQGGMMMDARPEMGSLFALTPQHSASQTVIAQASRPSHALTAAGSTPSPHNLHRPISRRVQSVPRPIQQRFSGSQGTVTFQSPMKLAQVGTTPGLGFRTSPVPVVAHRTPQPVTPCYPAQPAVALDSPDYWRNDAGLFFGRSFRVCFSPSGALYMPASVRSGGETQGGHRVMVVPLKDRVFKQREYVDLMKIHKDMRGVVEVGGGAESRELMQFVSHYKDIYQALADRGGSRQEAGSVFSLLQTLSQESPQGVLESFSQWLQSDAAEAAEAALGSLDTSAQGAVYDQVFARLSAKQLDEACDAALSKGKIDLALLMAQAGEHTSLCEDMYKQTEWLHERYGRQVDNGGDVEAVKLMQLYRLLAGDIDDLLQRMVDDASQDTSRVPGGQLLDWKRCLALYLWYQHPDQCRMVLPFEDMKKGGETQPSNRRFTLQGAFQCFVSRLRQTPNVALEDPIVCHPWPAYLEHPRTQIRQPSVVRSLYKCKPARLCAQLPQSVRETVVSSMPDKQVPGHGILKPPPSTDGVASKQTFLRADWPADLCFQLLHMNFHAVCSQKPSLAHALGTESHSCEAFDFELSWHLQQLFEGMLTVPFPPPKNPPPLFQIAKRFKLSTYQRCLLTAHFAAQLEMAGNWQLACYVVVASVWPGVGDAEATSDMQRFAVSSLRGLLSRHLTAEGESSISVGGVGRLTAADIAPRVGKGVDEVNRWFAEARTWRLRYDKSGEAASRRIFLDDELAQAMNSHDWERAHELLIDLLVADDVEHAVKPPQRTLDIMRKISAGMIKTHRADVWDKGAGPILELLEIWDQLTRFGDEGDDTQLDASAFDLGYERIAGKVQSACERIERLKMSTQRAVVGLCLKVSQSVWSYLHLTQGATFDGYDTSSATSITHLHLPPSNQLNLLQQLCVKTLDTMGTRFTERQGLEVPEGMDFETEEC